MIYQWDTLLWSSVIISRLINACTILQHTADHCKPVSQAPVYQSSLFLFLYLWLSCSLPLSVSESATGSDLSCPVGLCNVLCAWVSSAALSQVFVQASYRPPAIYLHTTATMSSAELFLDVMLLCFVLQQLKIHPYLAGHGFQIQSVLFLIRVWKWYYCVA